MKSRLCGKKIKRAIFSNTIYACDCCKQFPGDSGAGPPSILRENCNT